MVETHKQDNLETKGGNPVMRENTLYFLGMSLAFGACFAIAFYRNFVGIMYPLVAAAMLAACGLFLKKSGIPWKKHNWLYVGAVLLLGVSTVLTANWFVVCFNTVGILLLVTVFMLRQLYGSGQWGFGQYVCNILFLYLSMIPETASPFIHLGEYWRKRKGAKAGKAQNSNVRYIMVGVACALPVLMVLIGLLSSADQIFSGLVGDMFAFCLEQMVFSPNVLLAALLFLMGFWGSYCFLSALCQQSMPEWNRKGRKRNPVAAITFLSMVTAVYLLFCGIQAVFLFTGGRLLPEGYTYAEYARQGFFQLMFVCLFNFLLVISCLAVFRRNRLLQALLLVFCGCTYVMIASSAYRMVLYISTYHLSFLRVLVLWFLALLAVLLAGVALQIRKEGFGLFRYCMAAVTGFYLVFSFGRVDAVVASYNVARLGEGISYLDIDYLASLSVDAVPALSQCRLEHENHSSGGGIYGDFYRSDSKVSKNLYFTGCRRCRLEWKFRQVLDETEGMGLRSFHVSKYYARKAAQDFQKTVANHFHE